MDLAQEYYAATNLQIVTLEGLVRKKSTPRCEIDRQYKIVFDMLIICSEIEAPVPTGTRLWLLVSSEVSPLQGLYTFIRNEACEKQAKVVASLPYGGYHQRDDL